MTLAARPTLHITHDGSQLILPAVLVQQVLAVAVAHLRHVRGLAEVGGGGAGVEARVASRGARAVAAHEAVRDGEANEDGEARADNNEEGDEDAVHGGRLVGGLAGHCLGGRVVVSVVFG